eukprot:c56206_g1_i1 orf=1-366(-)
MAILWITIVAFLLFKHPNPHRHLFHFPNPFLPTGSSSETLKDLQQHSMMLQILRLQTMEAIKLTCTNWMPQESGTFSTLSVHTEKKAMKTEDIIMHAVSSPTEASFLSIRSHSQKCYQELLN